MLELTRKSLLDALSMGRSRKTLEELHTVFQAAFQGSKTRVYNRITWHGWSLVELNRQKLVGNRGYRDHKYTQISGFTLIAVKYR